jgi:hypothetical protein
MYLGTVKVSEVWEKLEDLIKAQIYGQSAFAFNTAKKYQIQCKSPNNLFIDEFVRIPTLSIATASIGTSTGISAASVVKTTFESIVFVSGVYDFVFTDSLISASITGSTGITNASVVKATFEGVVTESGVYDFIYDSGIGSLESDESGESSESIEPSWTFNGVDITLSDYGISVTGTPNDGDIVTIDFTAKNWQLDSAIVDLADYGISYIGTPVDTDTIEIDFIASNPGEQGIEVGERESIEYQVDTVNNSILCVRSKNGSVNLNIDVLEA